MGKPSYICRFCNRTGLVLVAGLLSLRAMSQQGAELKELDGEWIFVEDQTEGRTLEQMSPPMNAKFSFKIEDGAVVLVWGHGGNGNRNVRIALDGPPTEVPGKAEGESTRYRATWKDGVLTYEIESIRGAGQAPDRLVRRDFRMTKDGLVVRYNAGAPADTWWVGLYRHAEDIPMPTPAKATLADLKWLEGNWAGTRSTGATFEERWTPAKGGAMLAVSRSVNSKGQMFAFEFLRIMERNESLVYIAQPNGAPPTEFVLTEVSDGRAVFENPRHDYPKRIAYELSAEGVLTATIGYLKGGTPGKFEFKRDGALSPSPNPFLISPARAIWPNEEGASGAPSPFFAKRGGGWDCQNVTRMMPESKPIQGKAEVWKPTALT